MNGFNLACLQGSAMFSMNLFFLWLTYIPLYGYATFFLSSHQLMDIWVYLPFGCYE